MAHGNISISISPLTEPFKGNLGFPRKLSSLTATPSWDPTQGGSGCRSSELGGAFGDAVAINDSSHSLK